jgi:hypothetical protein
MFVPQLHVRWPLIGAAALSLFFFEAKPAVPATPSVPPPFGAASSSPRKVVPRGKPTLTGIVSVRDSTSSNAVAILEWSSPRPEKRLLRSSERDEDCELLSISPQTGKVILRDGSKDEQFELLLPNPAAGAAKPICVQFRNADVLSAFDIYQNLSTRTVIRPNAIPISRLTITIEAGSPLEAAKQLETAFNNQDLVVQHRADKFCLITPTARSMALDSIPDPPPTPAPNPAGGDVIFPPGLIKFQDSDMRNVLDVYQDLSGRTVIRPKLNLAKVSVKTQTAITREQAIWMLDALFHLSGLETLLESTNFVFAVPPERTNNLPHFDREAAFAALTPAATPPGSERLRLWDLDAQTFLNAYVSLTGRKAQPLSAELSKSWTDAPHRPGDAYFVPTLRFDVQSQLALDQAERVYVFQAVAFVNGLALENVGANECRLVKGSQ